MAEITEQSIYEAFGLGAQAQEVAAPAQEAPAADTNAAAQADQGGNEQEVADPVRENTDTDDGSESEPTAGGAENEEAEQTADTDKKPLTQEQRRQNAARRRQQEQQAAIDRAVADAVKAEQDKQSAFLEAFFAKAGLKNTITGKPITTMDEFNDWEKQFSEARMQKNLKAGKLTREDLDKVVSEHPTVKKAEEVIAQSAAAQKQAADAAFKAKVDGELAKIREMDPTIQSLEDLLKIPNFYQTVKSTNCSYLQAFILTSHERLAKAQADAARQQALNNVRSKDHLTSSGNSRGSGAVSVPADEMAVFRTMMPGASEAEIQAYYNQYHKK